jgi:hypothetical protein
MAAELRSPLRIVSVRHTPSHSRESVMNGIIYLVGLVVVVLAVASFFGFR